MANTDLTRALALHRKGDLSAASAAYRALLKAEPLDARLWEYLGVAEASTGARPPAGLTTLRKALLLEPKRSAALFNLAALHVRLAEDPLALLAFRRASAVAPHNPDVWMQRAHTAIRLGRNTEAMAAHREATLRAPFEAGTWEQRATLLRRAQRREDADQVTRQGLVMVPSAASLWAARSAVFFEIDKIDSALSTGKRAVAADPANADALANYAQALYRSDDTASAMRYAGEALRQAPDNPVIAFNLALYCLSAGNLAQGWRLYDARLVPTASLRIGLPGAIWRPSTSDAGRRLIVPTEQGLGDEVLFASCFPDLESHRASGTLASVTVECTDRLRPLMQRSFPAFRFFDRIRRPENRLMPADYGPITQETGADCTIMAGSLPGLFRPTLADLPAATGYLRPDPELVASWRQVLTSYGPGPYVGLSWRSRAGRDLGAVYYPGPNNLASFMSVSGLRFVTLQYDEDEEELREIERTYGVTIIRPEGLDLTNDLDGVAALIAALDAVVAPQNLVLSLAGALGKPGYTMPHTLNWVSLGTGQMPFYPSIRLDRRRREEGLDWAPVMTRLASRLKTDLKL